MKIAIIGYGKMGRMVEQVALGQGHRVTAIVDPAAALETPPSGARPFREMAEAGDLCGAEVAIEFTQPGTAFANVKALVEKRIPAVVGTTGWTDRLDEARLAAEAAGTALFWSSNFSLGVNIFYRVAWHAARLADAFPEYDVGGFESHHNKKLDSPSGTARTLVEGVLARMTRKDAAVWETLDRRPEPGELHFPSLRVGSVPGQHSLFLDSPADTIEITHTARNREGFASGAVRAAKWLAGEAGGRKGYFTMDDMLKDILG
ncbi:MAG: 4-hydroxy-tetrahydrodipicolinate reductase [Treponema sp.]|nr:4-hydroxy-tetrahydrodipicolinate reductase [Treponema sp.]